MLLLANVSLRRIEGLRARYTKESMDELLATMTSSVPDQASQSGTEVRLSEVLAGLSMALDLTEGQRPGHSVRSCAIGMRLAEVLGLSKDERSALFYALLMKDLGC